MGERTNLIVLSAETFRAEEPSFCGFPDAVLPNIRANMLFKKRSNSSLQRMLDLPCVVGLWSVHITRVQRLLARRREKRTKLRFIDKGLSPAAFAL